MEPPDPDLAKRANGTAEEYAEYERLLSLRYTKEPPPEDGPQTPDKDEVRLLELEKKLFGGR